VTKKKKIPGGSRAPYNRSETRRGGEKSGRERKAGEKRREKNLKGLSKKALKGCGTRGNGSRKKYPWPCGIPTKTRSPEREKIERKKKPIRPNSVQKKKEPRRGKLL